MQQQAVTALTSNGQCSARATACVDHTVVQRLAVLHFIHFRFFSLSVVD